MTPELGIVPKHFPGCDGCKFALIAQQAALAVPAQTDDTYMEATVDCTKPNIRNNSTQARVSSWIKHGRPPPETPRHEYPYDRTVTCPVAVEKLTKICVV